MSNSDEIIEELSSILNDHLDFISKLNETNPRLANILLIDFYFHIRMIKNLSILKKED